MELCRKLNPDSETGDLLTEVLHSPLQPGNPAAFQNAVSLDTFEMLLILYIFLCLSLLCLKFLKDIIASQKGSYQRCVGCSSHCFCFLLFENAIHSGDFSFFIIRTDLSSCLTMRAKKGELLFSPSSPLIKGKTGSNSTHLYIPHIYTCPFMLLC